MKILVCGDEQVGKTALISKFLKVPNNRYMPTIEDMHTFTLATVDHVIFEVILDLLVNPYYFRLCDAFLIVFDVTIQTSFCLVKNIIETIRDNDIHPKMIYIFGTHTDQKESRSISREFGKLLAFRYNCVYMEGSSVTGKNASKLFHKIVNDSVKKSTIRKRYSTMDLLFCSKHL